MSKKESQTGRRPTRRQIARSRKEQEKLRLVYMGLGLVVALILIVLSYGLVQTYIIEPNTPVAVVNGEEITTGEYRERVQYERFLLDNQYQQIVAQLQSLQGSEENAQFAELLTNQYQQLANQVLQQRSVVDRQTLDEMITDRLVAAEAAERGLTVSEAEITEQINRQLARQQGGLTAAAVEETATARAVASATAAVWTPTPTFTPSPTLTTTTEITQPTATPANTPTPAPTATPNIIGQDTLSAEYTQWINVVSEQTGLDEAQYRDLIGKDVLRQKLSDAVGEDVPQTAEQANARHILVETEEEAQAVVERLDAGEDFAVLAEELSTDPGSAARGGELGFAPPGRYVEAVDEAVFSLSIDEISEPIESQFGWHIIQVIEREERELSPADYEQAQRSAFTDWLTEARQAAQIEDLWDADRAPPDPLLDQ